MACNVKNGTDIGIYIDGTLISLGTSHDFEITMETRDASTKDSAGWKESCEAQRSWSASGEFLFNPSAAYGFDEIFAKLSARTMVVCKISSGKTGEKDWTGNAWVTSLSLSTPNEDSASYSLSLEGTGVLTAATQS